MGINFSIFTGRYSIASVIKRQKGKKVKRQKGEKEKRRKGEKEKGGKGEKEKRRKGEREKGKRRRRKGEREKRRKGEKEKRRKGEKEIFFVVTLNCSNVVRRLNDSAFGHSAFYGAFYQHSTGSNLHDWQKEASFL